MKRTRSFWTYAFYALLLAGVAGLLLYWMRPVPIEVESAPAARRPLRVVVTDDGRTRIREKYVVSAAVAGRVARVELDPGDEVFAGETVLAYIDPAPPSLLDLRSQAEARARLSAAETQYERAKSHLASAEADMGNAQIEFDRFEQLAKRNAVAATERDRAELRHLMARNEYRSAQLALRVAEFEVEQARSALIHLQRDLESEPNQEGGWRMKIVAPISGRVLRVFQESSAVVAPGTPLLEIGDVNDLEVVVDVLSSDAVKIRPGQDVELTGWGGDHPIPAKVRYVEPAGFMKVSAIGVEEQRVNVIIDFEKELTDREALGDDYRVDAYIIVDSAEKVLQIPHGALFRRDAGSAVFVIEGDRAQERSVEVGRTGRTGVEILAGLTEGEEVILYPSDQIASGVKVRRKNAAATAKPTDSSEDKSGK